MEATVDDVRNPTSAASPRRRSPATAATAPTREPSVLRRRQAVEERRGQNDEDDGRTDGRYLAHSHRAGGRRARRRLSSSLSSRLALLKGERGRLRLVRLRGQPARSGALRRQPVPHGTAIGCYLDWVLFRQRRRPLVVVLLAGSFRTQLGADEEEDSVAVASKVEENIPLRYAMATGVIESAEGRS